MIVIYVESGFSLLKAALFSAFRLEVGYCPNWQNSFPELLPQLRPFRRDPNQHSRAVRRIVEKLMNGTAVNLQDDFPVSCIIARASDSEIYWLGPFRSNPVNGEMITQLQRSQHLQDKDQPLLMQVLESIPSQINTKEGIGIVGSILHDFHGFPNIAVTNASLGKDRKPGTEGLPAETGSGSFQSVEERYQHEAKLSAFVADGNEARAMEEAQYFVRHAVHGRTPASSLYAANTVLRKAAQSTNISPVLLEDISRRYAGKIALCSTTSQLDALYLEMVADYCRLCRDHAAVSRSPKGRRLLEYILLNLNSDLSATVVGYALGFSPRTVAQIMQQETGKTLNQYVTEERIRVACRLLKKTGMPISEIANYVGIADWNYFTKVFRKYRGCTPREYRKRAES